MARFQNPYPQRERRKNHIMMLWFWKKLNHLSEIHIERLHKLNKRARNPKSGSCHGFLLDGVQYFPIDNGNMVYAVCGSDRESSVKVDIKETVKIEGKTYVVTEIGMFGFSNCVNLKDIQLPDSIWIIGRMAFANCNSLEKVIIHGKQNIEFGNACFEGCDFNKLKIERR